MYTSVVLSIFTRLCNYDQYLSQNISSSPKETLHHYNAVALHFFHPTVPGNLISCLYIFANSRHFYKWNLLTSLFSSSPSLWHITVLYVAKYNFMDIPQYCSYILKLTTWVISTFWLCQYEQPCTNCLDMPFTSLEYIHPGEELLGDTIFIL